MPFAQYLAPNADSVSFRPIERPRLSSHLPVVRMDCKINLILNVLGQEKEAAVIYNTHPQCLWNSIKKKKIGGINLKNLQNDVTR